MQEVFKGHDSKITSLKLNTAVDMNEFVNKCSQTSQGTKTRKEAEKTEVIQS